MLQIRITNTVFDSGNPKYLAGQLYPVTEDTQRQVALHNGEKVDVPTEAEQQAEAEADALAEQQAAAQQPAAPTDVPPEAAPAPAPAPAATTAARKRAGS